METIEGKISEITAEDKTRNYKFTFVDKEARESIEDDKTLNILILGHRGTLSQVQYMPPVLEDLGINVNMHIIATNWGGIDALCSIAKEGETARADDNLNLLPHIYWNSKENKIWKIDDWADRFREITLNTQWHYVILDELPVQNAGHTSTMISVIPKVELLLSSVPPIMHKAYRGYKLGFLLPSLDFKSIEQDNDRRKVWEFVYDFTNEFFCSDYLDIVFPGSLAAMYNTGIGPWDNPNSGHDIIAGIPSYLVCLVNTMVLLKDAGINRGIRDFLQLIKIVQGDNPPIIYPEQRKDYEYFEANADLADIIDVEYIDFNMCNMYDYTELALPLPSIANDWKPEFKSRVDV